jgi:hypothetical protein
MKPVGGLQIRKYISPLKQLVAYACNNKKYSTDGPAIAVLQQTFAPEAYSRSLRFRYPFTQENQKRPIIEIMQNHF